MLTPGALLTVQTIGGPMPARYVRRLNGSRIVLGRKRSSEFHLVTLIYPSGAEGKPRRVHSDDIKKARQCRICDCSDFFPCEGGCGWVARDLCSSCAV